MARASTKRMQAEGDGAPVADASPGHNAGLLDAATINKHYEAIVAAEVLVAEARGKLGAAFKAYEEAGGDRKALKFAMKLRNLSKHQQTTHINNIVQVAKAIDLPIGSQLTLLDYDLTDGADGDTSVH